MTPVRESIPQILHDIRSDGVGDMYTRVPTFEGIATPKEPELKHVSGFTSCHDQAPSGQRVNMQKHDSPPILPLTDVNNRW